MNAIRNAAMLALAVMTLAACSAHTPDTAADEAALKADPPNWFKAYNAGDVDSVVALYAEDALVLPASAPAATGHAAIREYIATDIENSKKAGVTANVDDITGVGVSGDTGWVSGTFSVVDASGATVDTGKFLSVYRRTAGGWKMIRDIWNSDKAPAATQEPAATEPAPEPAT